MEIINLENNKWFDATEFYKIEPETFIGCSKSPRFIIKNKNIKKDDYMYAKYITSTNTWVKSNESYRRAKIIISKEWCENNMKMFNSEIKTKFDELPSKLELNEEEKFKNIDGTVVDIDVRGERKVDGIYFCVKDIERGFGIKNINSIIQKQASAYKKNKHYKNFVRTKFTNCKSGANKKLYTGKHLYLTYFGLIKLLINSKSENAEHFQKWLLNIIYVHQFGVKKEKQILADKLLGNSLDDSRKILKSNKSSLACIYLLTLGYVKDLRKSMKISAEYEDDMLVVKFGQTQNIYKRLSQHKKTFSKIKNVEPHLKYYCFVDSTYKNKAEKSVKDLFKETNKLFFCESFTELAIVDKSFLNFIEEQYSLISNNYVGTQHDVINLMKHKEFEYKEKEHLNEIKLKDIELKLKDTELKLMAKENEILMLKLRLANKNHS